MYLGENVDTSGFRDDGWVGVGWEILRAGQRVEEGGVSRLLSLVFCLEGKERKGNKTPPPGEIDESVSLDERVA